jgi:hypothetical protein
VLDAVFNEYLGLHPLKECGLLKGRKVGIDSSVIEADASLKSLVVRNTEEAYWDYVKKLAQAAGIDPNDDKAVRQFDRKRPGKKLSNEQFKNRHDACYNLSQLLRKKFGCGTLKMALAAGWEGLFSLLPDLLALCRAIFRARRQIPGLFIPPSGTLPAPCRLNAYNLGFSTVC